MSTYSVSVQGKTYSVEVKERRGTSLSFTIDGESYSVVVEPVATETRRLIRPNASSAPKSSAPAPRVESRGTPNEVRAPIPGIVSDVKVAAGTSVDAGATLVVIEAMKMENPIRSHRAGVVKEVHVSKGSEIGNGALLITFEE